MMLYQFDDNRQALIGPDGQTTTLRPQSLGVFRLLLENADQVVSRETIHARVWGNLSVTDDSISQCISDIRRVLGVDYRHLLKTVPKKGYLLSAGADSCGAAVLGFYHPQPIVPASEYSTELSITEAKVAPEKHREKNTKRSISRSKAIAGLTLVLALLIGTYFTWHILQLKNTEYSHSQTHNGPTLAVLPFKNASSDVENRYFSDGITEDIISALTRYSDLRVMSWNAVSQNNFEKTWLLDKKTPHPTINYLITGSVRHSEDRVRISIQLIDTARGQHLWSEKYDEPIRDIFELQDKISRRVAATLSSKVYKLETGSISRKDVRDFKAYDFVLRGRQDLRARTRTQNLTARRSFERAIEIDPDFSAAYIDLSITYIEEFQLGWTEWPDKAAEIAIELLYKAISLEENHAQAHSQLSRMYMYKQDYSLSDAAITRALALNPDNPSIQAQSGYLHLWMGKPDEAIPAIEFSQKYDPFNPVGLNNLGVAYYLVGRLQDAVTTLERGLKVQTESSGYAQIFLSAAYVEMGRIELARKSALEIRQYEPFFDLIEFSRVPMLGTEENRQRIQASLRKVLVD